MINKPGEKPFFSIDSVKTLVGELSLDTVSNEEEFGRYFNLSVQIYTDETKIDLHYKIRNKLEFLEC